MARLDSRFPLVTIGLLRAMKGMETARVGMRESRKEMMMAAPADRLLPAVSLLSELTARADSEEAAGEMKSLSVSAEVMAPGLERTVETELRELSCSLLSCTTVASLTLGSGGETSLASLTSLTSLGT